MAAVMLVAFNTTLIVFSSSLLSDNGTFSIWVTRLTQFLIAGAFAIGMMALLWPRNDKPAPRRPHRPPHNSKNWSHCNEERFPIPCPGFRCTCG